MVLLTGKATALFKGNYTNLIDIEGSYQPGTDIS
jgi:hypothetical protein